jgi:hypothetical protein
MIWPIALLLLLAFVIVRVSEHMSPESKARRRRRKSHRPLTYKTNRHTTVRFS